MKVFVCTDHGSAGASSVVASVVVAPDESSARAALDGELRKRIVAHDALQAFTLREVSTTELGVLVLADGAL